MTARSQSEQLGLSAERLRVIWLDRADAPEGIVARIDDDGTGSEVAATLASYATRGSLGLLQMRESARLAGGRLEIDSSPGQGTRVRLWIPA